jgi:hypothetical protein
MSDTTTNVTIVNTTIENSGESSVTTSPRAMYGVVNLIGRSSEGGGEIFGNYVDNKAYGFYSAAFGNHSVAGKKICKLNSLINKTNKTITLSSVLNNNVEG